ncbi:MAG: ABC transporter substrate-binding protein [candidate division WOR-3 bacterium]|nr:ABC transporter substrate-binding protein [candidate division WOR-3 bacterium]
MLRSSWLVLSSLLIAALLATVVCSRPGETRIGVILPLTGDMAKYGKTISAAADLAVDEINKKQATSGLKFKLVFEDDQLNPTTGASAARKLIDVDKVSAIIGSYASSVTLAVAPIAESSHVVLLSPGSSSPKITEAGDYVFRNCVSDVYEGSEMAKFAYDKAKLRTCAILYVNNEFGVGLRDVFRKKFEELGGKVVANESYEQGSTDYRTQLAKTGIAKPEAIYLVGYQEMATIFRQAKQLGIKSQWLATTMLNDQSLVDKIPSGAADGAIFASWQYSPDNPDTLVQGFVARFRARAGMDPDVFAANTYDAVYLLGEAAAKGSSREALRAGLAKIVGFQGVTGETSFDKNGDVQKPIVFRTITAGKIVNYAGN